MTKKPAAAPSTELEDLRARLAEAEAVLNAIRDGEADALLIAGKNGKQVHTLSRACRQLIETISEGAVTLSNDGIILYCNNRLAEMLELPLEQILGTPLRDYMQTDDQQMLATVLEKACTKPAREELQLKIREGRRVPIYLSASRLMSQHEEGVFSLVITDLTEQKQHEKIVEAERLARLILEQAADAIIVCDKQGEVIRASQAARQFCSNNPLAAPFAEMFPLRTDRSEPLVLDSILQGESLHNVDVTLDHNGQTFNLILNAGPLLSEKEILGCVMILTDITERKRIELYRELSRDVLQILNEPGDLKTAIQHVLTALKKKTGFDAVGLRLKEGDDFPYFAQQGFPEDFLLTENELIGRDAAGGVCRDENGDPCLECTCGLVLSGKTDPSNSFFTQGGSFWTNDSFPMLDLPADKDPRFHPRTECIRREYASVALIPIKTKDKITGLIQLNDRRKGSFSLATIELMENIAAHIGTVLTRKQTEDEIETLARFPLENPNPVLRISTQGILQYANAAADTILPALGVEKIDDSVNAEWRAHIDNAVAETHPIQMGFQTEDRVFDATLAPVTNHGYVNLYARDITEQKQAEKEREQLQTQLIQSQKMESVGRLAGGVAHDFNNMLQVILGHAELGLLQIDPANPLLKNLTQIQNAAQRSGALTGQLLAFAREQPIAPKILNLNDEIGDLLKLLRRLLREEVKISWRPGAHLHPVKLDPVQVDQILVNLCVNAQDAVADGGEIIIETGNVTLDETDRAIHAEVVPGAYVFLAVSDNGCGMDRETLVNIFDPFFTTKEKGKGTGLGLATVYGIVRQNNGFIEPRSEPGKGTTFTIYLPQTDDVFLGKPKKEEPPLPKVHGETILLVEDEPSLCALYKQFLDKLGYSVLMADTPQKAIKLFSQHSDDIRLLLTDVVMPGMNGKQLAKKVHKINPAVKVLFMSGYTADVIVERGVIDQDIEFIAKPFSCSELAYKVQDVMGTHDGAESA